MTRKRAGAQSAIVNVWGRELGQVSSRNFAHRVVASQDLVLRRLDVQRKLDEQYGFVNTICFNKSGDILVSGSEDMNVILWDWESGRVKHSFPSGHSNIPFHGNNTNNVFHDAKLMPYSEDRSIVMCADGEVRHAQILDSRVETKQLALHGVRVHKLAVEPGGPHVFYTCGQNGLVQRIDLRTESAASFFTCRTFSGHSSHHTLDLNSIAIDPRRPNLFAVGGSDPLARVYDIRRYRWDGSSEYGQPVDFFCPNHLVGDQSVTITGLAYSDQSELVVSYNDELIYLFTKDLGLGPNGTFSSQVSESSDTDCSTADNLLGYDEGNTKASPQSYKGHKNFAIMRGVNFFGPKCEYVVSGSDCGRIFMWNKKGGELVRVMEAGNSSVNRVETHPHDTVLASIGIGHDIKMWVPKGIPPPIIHEDMLMNFIPERPGFYPLGTYDEYHHDDGGHDGNGDSGDDFDDDYDYEYYNDDDDEDNSDDSNDDSDSDSDSDSSDDDGDSDSHDDDDEDFEDNSDDSSDDDCGDHCETTEQINGVSNEQLEEEDDDDGGYVVSVKRRRRRH